MHIVQHLKTVLFVTLLTFTVSGTAIAKVGDINNVLLYGEVNNDISSRERADRAAIAVTFGGLVSEASGGDFSDGAVTSLMIYLYNEFGAYWDSKQTTWIYHDNDSQEAARTSWRAQIDGAYDQVGGGIADGWHSHPAVGVPFLAPLKPLTKLFGGLFKGTKWIGKVDPNKLNHVFGQKKHRLGPLLDKFGGNQEKAFRALDGAAQQALKGGKLNLKNGINTQTRVNVNGVEVDLVGGRVINGRFHIGSAYRSDIP